MILRPWLADDAPALYEYASDERVGQPAGWPPHRSPKESEEVIRDIFSADGIFAVTLRGNDKAIGCIGIVRGAASNFPLPDDEGELSYWIGVPFWGRGLIPEAALEMLRYGFEDMGLKAVWCGYFDGNGQSLRVQQKCGFNHHHTDRDKFFEQTQDIRTEHVTRLTRDEWAAGRNKG